MPAGFLQRLSNKEEQQNGKATAPLRNKQSKSIKSELGVGEWFHL